LGKPNIYDDRKIIPLRLNAYRQSTPAIISEGSIQIEPSLVQKDRGESASINIRAPDGTLCTVIVIQENGEYKLSVSPINQ